MSKWGPCAGVGLNSVHGVSSILTPLSDWRCSNPITQLHVWYRPWIRFAKPSGMENKNILRKRKTEHGGSFSFRKRRSRRPLDVSRPVHLVLKSELATGDRNLKNHRRVVLRILIQYSKHFRIRVYEKAICGNHIHCLVRARSKRQFQGFFRVLAGQIAQEILELHPLSEKERGYQNRLAGGTPESEPHPKNKRSFWALLAYTRIVRGGYDFRNVRNYIIRNVLETERIIPYKARAAKIFVRASEPSAQTQRRRREHYWFAGIVVGSLWSGGTTPIVRSG